MIDSRLLPFVDKPLRYLGNELNIVRKDLTTVSLRGVLCFPDVYDVGMSHYGLQILYHIVNRHPSWALGRVFQPWPDAESIMRREGIALYDLEYRRPLCSADWVGFTVQYELQYTNIVNMLDLSGIPVFAADRSGDTPIVIMGGPCMGNPEPLADIADAFVIGDGEESLVHICAALEEARRAQEPRARQVDRLSAIEGVYVPSRYKISQRGSFQIPEIPPEAPLRPVKIPVLSAENYPTRPLVPLIDVVHHRLAVEIMRGCTRGCRFCSAGTYYRPVRERPVGEIFNSIAAGMLSTGWREVGLLSLSTADYSQLTGLFHSALSLTQSAPIDVSLPSTRIDALTTAQFDALCSVTSPSSFTIAPEAGSPRLRKVINKDFSDQQIFDTVDILFAKNVQTLKLYFMIGLPTETREDLDAMIDLVRAIAHKAGASHRRMVNVAVSPFSPKPNTPFQWEAMDPVTTLAEKSRYLKDSLRHVRNVRLSYREAGTTFLETVLARGDRAVGRLVVEAWKQGAKLDGWDEHFSLQRWSAAAQSANITLETYTGVISQEQPLPWQGISTGVSQEFLRSEWQKSRLEETTDDCRSGACSLCGACDSPGSGLCRVATSISEQPVSRPAPRSNVTPRRFYRFVYSKGQVIRFLGHLDLVNIVHRAFRAASLPVAYSEGFSPHARMAFGPPLGLATAGLAEVFDVEMTRSLAVDEWHLPNTWLPAGLRLVGCKPCSVKPVPVNSAICSARYHFEPLSPIDPSSTRQKIAEIMGRQSIIIRIQKAEKRVDKDLRPMIREAEIVEDSEGRVRLEALLSASAGRTCKPAEFLAQIFPEARATDFVITRTACLGELGESLAS